MFILVYFRVVKCKSGFAKVLLDQWTVPWDPLTNGVFLSLVVMNISGLRPGTASCCWHILSEQQNTNAHSQDCSIQIHQVLKMKQMPEKQRGYICELRFHWNSHFQKVHRIYQWPSCIMGLVCLHLLSSSLKPCEKIPRKHLKAL